MTKTKLYKCSRALEQQLLRWALDGSAGKSSKFMAGVAAFGKTYRPLRSDLPKDYDDLKRCVVMVGACQSFHQAFPELSCVSPSWERFIARWEELRQLVVAHGNAWGTPYSIYDNILKQIEQPADE